MERNAGAGLRVAGAPHGRALLEGERVARKLQVGARAGKPSPRHNVAPWETFSSAAPARAPALGHLREPNRRRSAHSDGLTPPSVHWRRCAPLEACYTTCRNTIATYPIVSASELFQDRQDNDWLRFYAQARSRHHLSRFSRFPATRVRIPGRDFGALCRRGDRAQHLRRANAAVVSSVSRAKWRSRTDGFSREP